MNNTLIQRRTVLLGGLLLGAGVKAMAATEPWPSRPIRLVVAGSAGRGSGVTV